MCLIVLGWKVIDQKPLVLAANRDEFHQRPTTPSTFWPGHPELLAGRDLEAGGTWMGVSRYGRFAAVTNFRDPAQTAPAKRSRGDLPLGYLASDITASEYLQRVAIAAGDYAGFNLLLGTGEELWYYSNRLQGEPPRALPPGIYGLSNERLDTPWPKVVRARSQLAELIAGEAIDHATLGATVANRGPAAEHELHPSEHGAQMDRRLSAQFIVTPDYGTRATTTLWLQRPHNNHGSLKIEWQETHFDRSGHTVGQNHHSFHTAQASGV
ncbi:MAG: NRDE family protein [Haliea sp.]|jgi:uncharacterized protein with NRDE domain|nr:NRDE family protein [Haliea sp.]MDP5064351.1 NRDE family protein [Haliea sp.]